MIKFIDVFTKIQNWIMSILPNWMKISNRDLHFIYGLKLAIIFSCLFSAGCGLGMEYKDWEYQGSKGGRFGWLLHDGKFGWFRKNCNGFDWLDFWATTLGGIVGSLLRWLLVFLISWLIF